MLLALHRFAQVRKLINDNNNMVMKSALIAMKVDFLSIIVVFDVISDREEGKKITIGLIFLMGYLKRTTIH